MIILANKNWEVDPLVGVLLSERSRPSMFKDFVAVNHPLIRPPGFTSFDPPARPRITFSCGISSVEVWCLQDLMNTGVSGSNSAEKARVLPKVLAGTPVHAVMAFGTAGFPEDQVLNGSVIVGSRVFIHDPTTKEKARYTPTLPDAVSSARIPGGFFRGIDADVRFPAEGRFLRSQICPTSSPIILAGHNWISLGAVNVTNYDDYVWTDPETVAAFRKLDQKTVSGRIGCMETTHGVISEQSGKTPFLFVSGIANAVPWFDVQVVPRAYAENFVAAHNAAVALAWLLPEVVSQIPAPAP